MRQRRRGQAGTSAIVMTALALVVSGWAPAGATFWVSASSASPLHTPPQPHVHQGLGGETDVDVCSSAVPVGQVRCAARRRTDLAARRSLPGSAGSAATPGTIGDGGAYSPAFLQSAYNAPSAARGAGQTVAVVDPFDNAAIASELATYRAHYGLPACTAASGCFRKVNQQGGTTYPPPDQSWAQEISLDVEMVSALCPNCNILLVEANSADVSDVGTAVNTAVALGANVVSNSYGGAEFPTETSDDAAYYRHPGVAIVASAGDQGYGVIFPAASSEVAAVGGTTLTQTTDTGVRNASETAWSGGGSGCSAYVSKPSWQHDASCANRMVADVAAVADPSTGVWVFTGGTWAIFGGTSVAAPIVGAMYALAGNPVGTGTQPASYPYAHTAATNDVVSGSNGSCSTSYFCRAGPGYDGPTGLGTPNSVAAFGAPFLVGPGITVAVGAGSDTTQGFMTALAANGYGTSTVQFYNIPADFSSVASPGTYTVPGESSSSCPDPTVWSVDPLSPGSSSGSTEGVAPYGSSAGRNYLAAEDNAPQTGPNANSANPPQATATGTDDGCVNVARSSLGPRTSTTGDKVGFEYDAYALDAVSWASTSLRAPATLTQAQLSGIYNCTLTDWGQVGGTPGPIQRYIPATGSDTWSVFVTEVLLEPSTWVPPSGIVGCPDTLQIIENEAQQVGKTDTDSAILPYSAGEWDYQQSNSINPTLDRRANQFGALAQLKGITTASPALGAPIVATPVHWVATNHDYELDSSTTGVVKETNIKVNILSGHPSFPGIHYLFNVLDPIVGGYAGAESLFGFTNTSGGSKSPLCDNLNGTNGNSVLALNALQSASFAPLDTTTNINGSNLAGSTCRQFRVAT